ncbi:hypothetical protein J6590_036818 [Homalodisca vitripennis]|nr:hypothetical protein J6590_036818 [Homalodisca vitripennis]
MREGMGSTNRLHPSRSSDSLVNAKYTAGGSVRIADRIADQVIEEVDEQQTITSMAGRPPEQRPTIQDIFPNTGPPPPSAPLPVPPGRNTSTYFSHSAPNTSAVPPTSSLSPARSVATYTDMLSMKSAPGLGNDNSSGLGSGSLGAGVDTISIGSNTDSSEDEFTRLKHARMQERIRYARSISAQQGMAEGEGESESLLTNMMDSTRIGSVRSPRNSLHGDRGES